MLWRDRGTVGRLHNHPSHSGEGAALRFVRRPSLAARSGGQKRPVLARFWAVFACRVDRCERCETSAISAPWNPPGGTGVDGAFVIAGKVPARRFVRSPPLAARSGGPKRPVLACFWGRFRCCGGRVSGRLDVALV
ncbi:hypothetical protein OPV22_030707 [Ensete ventricosum]|uniref:Uncharacterized protein n=1 Tax=Ensete ventricosum TaxID=4639 RepID=A0AAV8QGK9_ENSVE|nr:hypothetical protein OPV22_030707 [Ensete ventricosum]